MKSLICFLVLLLAGNALALETDAPEGPVPSGTLVVVQVLGLEDGDTVSWDIRTKNVSNYICSETQRLFIATPCRSTTIELECMKINWDKRTLEKTTEFIPVGSPEPVPPGPEPGPDNPDPPMPLACDALPGDVFNNIAQKACRAASLLSNSAQTRKKEVAAAYRATANALDDPGTGVLTLGDARNFLAKAFTSAFGPHTSEWNNWGSQVSGHQMGVALDRTNFTYICRAIANGLDPPTPAL